MRLAQYGVRRQNIRRFSFIARHHSSGAHTATLVDQPAVVSNIRVNRMSAANTAAPVKRSATEFHIATRLSNFTSPTVWHEFTPLAATHKAMPLGQGFPGWSPPKFVQEAAAKAVTEVGQTFLINQYARSAGHLPLVNKLAEKYSRTLGRTINPLTEIVVTVGASEALCAMMLGLLDAGDEIVMLEPAFDIYIAQAEMCGATIKYVPLRVRDRIDGAGGTEWYVDMNDFKQAFSNKTRIFLLNTPQNPTGKMFSHDELTEMSDIIKTFDQCIVLSDEVYEHMCYDKPHISIATLPGMYERSVTISSAGKTFSVTGWKIGWIIGAEHLVRCAGISHSWIPFAVCTPLQQAVADSLIQAEQPYEGHTSYYAYLLAEYRRKRTMLLAALRASGIEPIEPDGGFFIVGDSRHVKLPEPYASDKTVTRDWSLCRWLTKEIGVGVIPPSSFYGEENKHMAENHVRFAFCKPDEVLQEAAKRLLKVREFIKSEK